MKKDIVLKAMQATVDVVLDSPHPTHKIAACVFDENAFTTATNFWPQPILDKLGKSTRIGGSSGTIHAETAALLKTKGTDGKALCVTDPFCPNCAKNVVEAGIRKIYIDHKGFDKTFWAQNKGHFENMSMEITARAGISVYKVHRKEKSVTPIFEPEEGYSPPEDSPIEEERSKEDMSAFKILIEGIMKAQHNRKIAVALAREPKGRAMAIIARAHVVTGFSMQNDFDVETITQADNKYSFIEEPVNRLLMYIQKRGYTLLPDYLFCSQVPTAREQVNLVGADIKTLYIHDMFKSRDESGLKAKELLQAHDILNFQEL